MLAQGGAQGAGKVMPSLRPIEAGLAEHAAPRSRTPRIDPEVLEERLPLCGDLADSVREDEIAASPQRVGEGDAEPAGEMVVAGAPAASAGSTRARRGSARAVSPATTDMASTISATSGDAMR
jgi:hypothetical protein